MGARAAVPCVVGAGLELAALLCGRAGLLVSSLLPRPSLPPSLRPHTQDPILRYGGMFVAGLAYCGTSNNAAIQRLLHFAVSGALPGWWQGPGARPGMPLRGGLQLHAPPAPHALRAVRVNSPGPASAPHAPLTPTDVSNDVRRAAVMNLGFVLASTPEQCPKIVALLAESYNPHVR